MVLFFLLVGTVASIFLATSCLFRTKVSVPPTKLHCASYEDLFTEEDDVANNSDDQVMVHATESLEQENRSLQKYC